MPLGSFYTQKRGNTHTQNNSIAVNTDGIQWQLTIISRFNFTPLKPNPAPIIQPLWQQHDSTFAESNDASVKLGSGRKSARLIGIGCKSPAPTGETNSRGRQPVGNFRCKYLPTRQLVEFTSVLVCVCSINKIRERPFQQQ